MPAAAVWTAQYTSHAAVCAAKMAPNHARPLRRVSPQLGPSACSACLRLATHVQDGQLKPEDFTAANTKDQVQLESRMQDGYDHSYYFIATFVEDHLRFHAKALGI